MKPRVHVSLLLLCVATAIPASAITDVTVRIEPLQPRVGEDFAIVVEGMTEIAPVMVEEVSRGDQSLEVRLHREVCNFACVPQPFRIEVPIDGSTSPFLEGDLVELHVNGRVGAETARETLFWSYFAVGELFYHSMEPRIVLEPGTPTDNDHIRLLVPVRADYCGPSVPWLDRIERDGSSISVFLRFSPGFGGQFSTFDGPDSKCTPPGPYLGVTPVDLGLLAAGDYAVELYFQSTHVESLPLRVSSRTLGVEDGPDSVGLQDGRFTVELRWSDSDGNIGVGKPVPGPSSDSTLFSFFEASNWEILIKVLDGCAINDRFWVFGAAATDVEYTITITDTASDSVWTYTNPLGMASAAINDTDAFATCQASVGGPP